MTERSVTILPRRNVYEVTGGNAAVAVRCGIGLTYRGHVTIRPHSRRKICAGRPSSSIYVFSHINFVSNAWTSVLKVGLPELAAVVGGVACLPAVGAGGMIRKTPAGLP